MLVMMLKMKLAYAVMNHHQMIDKPPFSKAKTVLKKKMTLKIASLGRSLPGNLATFK
jgi:hypothetical protein